MDKEGTITNTTLLEIGHPREATELTANNSMADGIIMTLSKKTVKSNGYVVLLDKRLGQTGTIQGWLGLWGYIQTWVITSPSITLLYTINSCNHTTFTVMQLQ
jgi:hypothetical protein